MTGSTPREDLQSQFEKTSGDFLGATKLEDTIGLCLSGGGYRAMIYHVGALLRLNELGFLPRLAEVSSVSGGSIAAGMLALAWPNLEFDPRGRAANFGEAFAKPLIAFSRVRLDIRAVLSGFLPGRSAADAIANAYDQHLFGGRSLQDITDKPRFTFMATNLQTGSGWRFSKPYAADYRVGIIDGPDLPLSRVVAASSAFPPFLSPVRIDLSGHTVRRSEGADLHKPPFTETAVLTDGGVYDNLGLERVWKRCRTIFVSNAGLALPEIGNPSGRWFGQVSRVLGLLQTQAEYSRRRILFGMNGQGARNVAYWGIDTPLAEYHLADALPISAARSASAATQQTRLSALSQEKMRRILEVGYAGADASLRKYGFAPNEPVASLEGLEQLYA